MPRRPLFVYPIFEGQRRHLKITPRLQPTTKCPATNEPEREISIYEFDLDSDSDPSAAPRGWIFGWSLDSKCRCSLVMKQVRGAGEWGGWLIVNFRFIEAHWGSIVALSPSQSLCHSVSESKKMKLHNVGQSGLGCMALPNRNFPQKILYNFCIRSVINW